MLQDVLLISWLLVFAVSLLLYIKISFWKLRCELTISSFCICIVLLYYVNRALCALALPMYLLLFKKYVENQSDILKINY